MAALRRRGRHCVDIDGADGTTHIATADDVGHTLRVLVTAHNVAGDGTATTAPTDVVVARGPVNTSAPSVSGSVRIGNDLTADRGDWTGTPDISYAYQWQRCATATTCFDIAGATSRTYTTTGDDVGAALRVQVTATNTAGSATAVSDRTAAITADPPRNETTPEVIGTARVGETLAVDQGSWSGTGPLTFSYQWQRCDAAGDNCAAIAGQTERMYALTGADQGSTIRVVVTASGPGGVAARATDATATVEPRARTRSRTRRSTRWRRPSPAPRAPATRSRSSAATGPAPTRSPTPTSGSAATATARTA